jgi:adenosine deaminase
VHTGVVAALAEHPIGLLRDLRFRVTVNTDNRLMSGLTLSSELCQLAGTFHWGWEDLSRLTINAMKSAFFPFDDRLVIIEEMIKPGFVALLDPPVRPSAGNRNQAS